jgi:hypothetical protein
MKGKAVKKRKPRSHYEELWLAAGALLADAEDPKNIKTATAMCGRKELMRLYRVWKKADV